MWEGNFPILSHWNEKALKKSGLSFFMCAVRRTWLKEMWVKAPSQYPSQVIMQSQLPLRPLLERDLVWRRGGWVHHVS